MSKVPDAGHLSLFCGVYRDQNQIQVSYQIKNTMKMRFVFDVDSDIRTDICIINFLCLESIHPRLIQVPHYFNVSYTFHFSFYSKVEVYTKKNLTLKGEICKEIQEGGKEEVIYSDLQQP